MSFADPIPDRRRPGLRRASIVARAALGMITVVLILLGSTVGAGAQDGLQPFDEPFDEGAQAAARFPLVPGVACTAGEVPQLLQIRRSQLGFDVVDLHLSAPAPGSVRELRLVVRGEEDEARIRSRIDAGPASFVYERREPGGWVDAGEPPTTTTTVPDILETGEPIDEAPADPSSTTTTVPGGDVIVSLPIPFSFAQLDESGAEDPLLGPDLAKATGQVVWAELVVDDEVQSVTAPVGLDDWLNQLTAWRTPPLVWPMPCASPDPAPVDWAAGPRLDITSTALRLRYSDAPPTDVAGVPVAWTRDRIEIHSLGYGDLIDEIAVDTATGQIEIYGRAPDDGAVAATSTTSTTADEPSTTTSSSTSTTATTTRPGLTIEVPEETTTEPPPTDPPETEPEQTTIPQLVPAAYSRPAQGPPTSRPGQPGVLRQIIEGKGPVVKGSVVEITRADLDDALVFGISSASMVGVGRRVGLPDGTVLDGIGLIRPYPANGTPAVLDDPTGSGDPGGTPGTTPDGRPIVPSIPAPNPTDLGRTREESKAMYLGAGAIGLVLLFGAAAVSARRR